MTEVSSIGATFPPAEESVLYDRLNNRVKGFCTESIESIEELVEMLSKLDSVRESARANRVTARFLINKKVTIPEELKGNIEALLELDGDFSEHNLVYYGKNFDGRKAKEESISRQRDEAEKIDRAHLLNGFIPLEIITRDNLSLRAVKPPVNQQEFDSFVADLKDLYEKSYLGDYAFPITTETVASLVRRDTNLVTVIQDRANGKILSVGVGETMKIPLSIRGERKILFIAEMSDAATPLEYASRGYYSAIAHEISRELMKIGVDLVYGEARASSTSVQRVCKKSGRKLARDAFKRASILHKHCIIGGAKNADLDDSIEDPRFRGFENLSVWYATREDLIRHYIKNVENGPRLRS